MPVEKGNTASPPRGPTFHLLRVRIKKDQFDALRIIAKAESEECLNNTTVSDLVRSAIGNLLNANPLYKQIKAEAKKRSFIPSGLADPPVIMNTVQPTITHDLDPALFYSQNLDSEDNKLRDLGEAAEAERTIKEIDLAISEALPDEDEAVYVTGSSDETDED